MNITRQASYIYFMFLTNNLQNIFIEEAEYVHHILKEKPRSLSVVYATLESVVGPVFLFNVVFWFL